MSQTIVAARDAETMRAAAAAAWAIGEDGEVLGGVTNEESEEDDYAEASDEEVAAVKASPRRVMPRSPDMDGDHGMPRIGGLGDNVLESVDFVNKEPAVEEESTKVPVSRKRTRISKKKMSISGRLEAAMRTTNLIKGRLAGAKRILI